MALPDFAYIDGFDHYTDKGDGTIDVGTLLFREWTAYATGSTPGTFIVAALSGPAAGSAVRISGTNGYFAIRRSLPGNYARHIGGVTIKIPTLTGNVGNAVSVALYDNTTAQISMNINWVSGTISVRRGDGGATVIATSVESVLAGGTFVLEWDITIHNTTGIIKVWLNGVLTSLNLTGQNTRVSANNFYNGLAIGMYGIDNGSRNADFDHLYSYSYTASGGSETPLLFAPIIETQVGTSDDTAQFAVGPTVLGKDFRTTTATNAAGANQLVLIKFTPEVNMTLQSVAFVPAATSAGAKVKAVLYSDSAGSPNTPTATGTEIVGLTSGVTATAPFGSGQALTGGTAYWIGYITDTSVAIQQYDSTSNLGRKIANTYASGAPNPAGAMTTGQPSWQIWGNCTAPAANYAQENKGEPTINEYNSSATVAQKDLFNFPALTTSPATIALMAVKVAALKSDGGARTINLPTKSGATTGNGSSAGQSPGISLAYLTSNFFTDPNTSAAWTAANLNAAKSGYEIAT